MAQPTSIRLPATVKERLERTAARRRERTSAVAVRLIDEGVRMSEHPGIVFRDGPAHGRVAAVMAGPDVSEVVDVLMGLDARGDERVAETAEWLAIHPSQVRVATRYYADQRDEIDREIAQRRREAEELRDRMEREQALLG